MAPGGIQPDVRAGRTGKRRIGGQPAVADVEDTADDGRAPRSARHRDRWSPSIRKPGAHRRALPQISLGTSGSLPAVVDTGGFQAESHSDPHFPSVNERREGLHPPTMSTDCRHCSSTPEAERSGARARSSLRPPFRADASRFRQILASTWISNRPAAIVFSSSPHDASFRLGRQAIIAATTSTGQNS